MHTCILWLMSCNMTPDKHSSNSLPHRTSEVGSLQDTWTKNMDFAPDVGWRWILCFEVIKIGKRPFEKQYAVIPYGVRKISIFLRNKVNAYMGDGIDFFPGHIWAVFKTPVGCLIEGIMLPNYMGIIRSQFKDPYKPKTNQYNEMSQGFWTLLNYWS